MHGSHSILEHSALPSMIIHDFHVSGTFSGSTNANAESVVYPNAVLALTVALHCFQPISWWRPKEFQRVRRIKLRWLPYCDVGDAMKSLALPRLEQRLCVATTEAIDHATTV